MQVKENEIRPQEVFDEYLRLTARDIVYFFSNVPKEVIPCPACGGRGNPLFDKSGFTYEECQECKTLYVSPRPVKAAFDAYYTDSPSTKFWATTFYKVTELARREKLWKPKAQMIKTRIKQYEDNSPIKYIIDIGGGYGVFDEEICKIYDVKPIIIEPSVHLATICREKGFEVIEKFMEEIEASDLPSDRKCFVSFELFEHLHNPALFLKKLYDVMKENDVFIFTTLSGMGIDIQVLGIHSKAVSPPHHLNFLNPKSIKLLLEKIGFKVLEVITPGKLDMDILLNNREHIRDHFWANYLDYATEIELQKMQEFIAEQKLSSHMMITCKKPGI